MKHDDLETDPKRDRDLPLVKLLPNLLTLTAACAGLTGVRFALLGEFQWSVRMVLIATILDGLDGRLARLLRSQSPLGAELDSLADFLNFGVAPALILYLWTLNDVGGIGWMASLCFTLCCLLRLARFNVGQKNGNGSSDYFEGVPSPAGALLVMMPMVAAFAFPGLPEIPAWLSTIYVLAIGLLMISRIHTFSFKNVKIPRRNARYVLLGAVLAAALLFNFTWATLLLVMIAYLATILVALRVKPGGGQKDL
ncbi:CDP-diacylglycerol--serine O-phosphatidyltransferase [Psychromarinibacter sp. S121]|uniref:CDP-diacylglycerol--serine O-phosphatidyltransferase n=1 Tax=Psychromarinibacter sp. S121 TaxID=3415127 RepID=UPI003C79D7B2